MATGDRMNGPMLNYFDHRTKEHIAVLTVGRTPLELFVQLGFQPAPLAYGRYVTECEFSKTRASVIIGHFSPEQLRTLVTDSVDFDTDCKVIVCVTTATFTGDAARHAKTTTKSGKSLYVLRDLRSTAFNETELRELEQITNEDASNIVAGKREAVSILLQSLFLPCIDEIIPALGILCQGYLAAGALSESQLASYDPSDAVGKALIGMGWAVAYESSLLLSRYVAGLGLAVQDELPGIEYWLEPFDPKGTRDWRKVLDGLRKQLEDEFKKEVPEAVTELLGEIEMRIESGGDAESSMINPAVVARAFSSFFSEPMEARK
jgi:hypothetical protein